MLIKELEVSINDKIVKIGGDMNLATKMNHLTKTMRFFD